MINGQDSVFGKKNDHCKFCFIIDTSKLKCRVSTSAFLLLLNTRLITKPLIITKQKSFII